MKQKTTNIQVDLDTLLKKGKLTSEGEHERALMLHRKLRLMLKEYPELSVKRSALRELIKAYEGTHWTDEDVTQELVNESDAAEVLVEQERQFLVRRKEIIRGKLKELKLTQKEFGKILGHSSATYISELINGIYAFSLRDLILIHALLKIDFEDLIPTAVIASEKEKVVTTIHQVRPDIKINQETLELLPAC